MRPLTTFGLAAALVLSAVVGGTLIGSAVATTEDDAGGAVTDERTGYCDTFLDELAAELGTSRDGLLDAGRAAALATVDAAVAAGDLTDDRAAELRERIETADGDGCALLGRAFGHGVGWGIAHGIDRGEVRGFLGGDVFEAAADALGIEGAELLDELRDAGSLEALAEAHGASYAEVTAAILAAVQADLDAAVAEGLSQERADAVIDRLTTWLEEGGEIGGLRPGRGGFWPAPFHGPWGGDDADEPDGDGDASGA